MSKVLIKHIGVIRNGIPIFYNLPLWENNLKSLEGQEIEIIIAKKHKKPSNATYGYYRGGIIRFCSQLQLFDGWTEEEIHDYWSNEFLSTYKEILLPNGQKITKKSKTSTKSLSQEEMNEYIEKICRKLAELGIFVPSPEQFYINKYRSIKQ